MDHHGKTCASDISRRSTLKDAGEVSGDTSAGRKTKATVRLASNGTHRPVKRAHANSGSPKATGTLSRGSVAISLRAAHRLHRLPWAISLQHGALPHRLFSAHQVCHLRPTLSVSFRQVVCPLHLRVSDAFTEYRVNDDSWIDGASTCPWTPMQCLSRTFGPAFSHPRTLPLIYVTQPSPHSGDDHRRCSDRLQVLSWNAGPVRGYNVQAVANRINVPWHVVCIQKGGGFTADRTLSDNFHVAVAHHCAVLLNQDTFEDDYTCTPIQVPCNHRNSSWALEGMVVSGKFGRHLDPTCRFSTVANVHINNEFCSEALGARCVATVASRLVSQAKGCPAHWRFQQGWPLVTCLFGETARNAVRRRWKLPLTAHECLGQLATPFGTQVHEFYLMEQLAKQTVMETEMEADAAPEEERNNIVERAEHEFRRRDD